MRPGQASGFALLALAAVLALAAQAIDEDEPAMFGIALAVLGAVLVLVDALLPRRI